MDPKKQQMNPELQQIYDRVMSTSAAPKAAAPVTPAVPGVQPAPAVPASHTPVSMPMPPGATGVDNSQTPTSAPTTNAFGLPQAPVTSTSSPAFGLPQAPTTPGAVPSAAASSPATPAPADPAGKPISSGSFVFNGNKVVNSDKTKAATPSAGKKIPGFLIPIGIIVLVVAWAALWAKIFGLF